MSIRQLWVQKYRPATLDEYVFKDDTLKSQVKCWISDGSFPHLLMSGKPGTGKTSLARLLCAEMNLNNYDILEINASNKNGVEVIRDTVIDFAQRIPFGAFKVIILNEAHRLSPSAQSILLDVLEEYMDVTRFIFTTNYPNKFIPPLLSRLQPIQFDKMDKTEYTAKAATILLNEGINFDIDTLDTFVTAYYPDLRKCINNLELNSRSGTLIVPDVNDSASDYMVEAVELFKSKKFREGRKLICKHANQEEIQDLFRWLYDNVEIFGNEDLQEKAILIIKQGLVDHTLVSDPEINLAAVLVGLSYL